jgi:hypothetical protein
MGIALQAPAPDPYLRAPDQLIETLTTISIEVEFLGNCLDPGGGDRTDARFTRLDRRYWDTRRKVEAIWGSATDSAVISEHFLTETFFPEKRRRCGNAQVQAALDNANAKLTEIEQSLWSAATQQRMGAWVGALRLCRDTVSQAEIGTDGWQDEPVLHVTLTAESRGSFAALTERSVGLKLAVLVDGRVISEPTINEPIRDGRFYLQARDPQTLERAQVLVTGIC